MSTHSYELTEALLDRTTNDRIGTACGNSVQVVATLVQDTPMIEISDYTLSTIREGELTLHRGWGWGFRYAGRSSKPIAVVFGQPKTCPVAASLVLRGPYDLGPVGRATSLRFVWHLG